MLSPRNTTRGRFDRGSAGAVAGCGVVGCAAGASSRVSRSQAPVRARISVRMMAAIGFIATSRGYNHRPPQLCGRPDMLAPVDARMNHDSPIIQTKNLTRRFRSGPKTITVLDDVSM